MLTGNPVAGLWEAAPWSGQAVQERQFQCLEAAGALFPRKAPAPSSTTLRLHSWLDLYLDTTAGGCEFFFL